MGNCGIGLRDTSGRCQTKTAAMTWKWTKWHKGPFLDNFGHIKRIWPVETRLTIQIHSVQFQTFLCCTEFLYRLLPWQTKRQFLPASGDDGSAENRMRRKIPQDLNQRRQMNNWVTKGFRSGCQSLHCIGDEARLSIRVGSFWAFEWNTISKHFSCSICIVSPVSLENRFGLDLGFP